MGYYIIVYKNTHDSMKADKKLNDMKIECQIMPTPTSITQSCGFCTRLDDKIDIDDLLEKSKIDFKNIYIKQNDKFILVR